MAMVVVFPVCLPMQAIMRFAGVVEEFFLVAERFEIEELFGRIMRGFLLSCFECFRG